ncbi:hypothetical protein OO012_05365 [Rhodobacteraceae bacterium KMM 6894]|nr:hypothetical protein [Rhodobacteraceae bacterium KMM 6894]
MSETRHHISTAMTGISDDPSTWGPPEAPLHMPVQNLSPAPVRFGFVTHLRQVLSGLRTGHQREI